VVNRLPLFDGCSFEGYDAALLMKETAKIRKLVTNRGTLEMLIPLCCTAKPVRYKEFRKFMKGISSKTLAVRLKELEAAKILERHAYNEIPPRVEYKLSPLGRSLEPVLKTMQQWGASFGKKGE